MRNSSFMLAAAVAVSVFSQTGPVKKSGTDEVAVTMVTADPRFVSGLFAVAVGVSGEVAGEQRSYIIPFMEIGQAKPSVGDRCQISWHWHSGFGWAIADGRTVREGRVVDSFSCAQD